MVTINPRRNATATITGRFRLLVRQVPMRSPMGVMDISAPRVKNIMPTRISTAPIRKHRRTLGERGELGDWAKREHEAIGRLVAQTGLDALITMGDLAKDIAQSAKAAGMTAVYTTDTHEQAARQLKELLHDGDTVLLKGSRSFAMEKILPYFERK